MKRKVSLEHYREIVRARITKGDAFRLDYEEYIRRQQDVTDKLNTMSADEIAIEYAYATYDIYV